MREHDTTVKTSNFIMLGMSREVETADPGEAPVVPSHQRLLHQRPTLKGSLQFQAVMDGAGGARRRGDEVQSEGSSGTVINGGLPETSAARLSIIRRPGKPSEAATASTTRSESAGVSFRGFHHYTIKAIAEGVGAQGQSSQPVINQR